MKKIYNIILLAIPLIIIFVFLIFVLERNKKITLPAPTGNFAVGRSTYEWTDTTRIDSLAPDPGKRELFMWVWYPTSKTEMSKTSEYLPEEWRKAIATRQGLLARFFTRKLNKIQPHSIEGGKLSSENSSFPVVIIKSGLGASVTDYTTLAEDLASNGYVVIGSESPYSNSVVVFSGGRVINDNIKGNPSNAASTVDRNRRLDRLVTTWSDDLHFILDKLEQLNTGDSANMFQKRLNLKEVGVLGHSLSGAAAFRFCFSDRRCKAGVSIDGTPFGSVNENRLSKPFMFLLADQSGARDSTKMQVRTNIDTIYNQLPESRVWINLKGTKHFNFTDQALIKEQFIAKRYGDLGSIEKRRGLEVTAACVRTFFNMNLKNLASTKIKDLVAKYPEIKLEK